MDSNLVSTPPSGARHKFRFPHASQQHVGVVVKVDPQHHFENGTITDGWLCGSWDRNLVCSNKSAALGIGVEKVTVRMELFIAIAIFELTAIFVLVQYTSRLWPRIVGAFLVAFTAAIAPKRVLRARS